MLKPISFTWDLNEHFVLPAISMWNYKGEKIISFFCSNLPVSAMKSILGNNKRTLKGSAKEFYEKHGILATNVVKIARGIVHNEVHKQFPEWYKLCRTKSWTPLSSRFEAIHTEELLQQCRKDGIANIIPIVAYYGKSPQELKKFLGEREWKKLCKNSYSRNRLLFLKSNSRVTPVDWNAVPSTILKGRTQWMPEVYEWLIKTQNCPLKSITTDYNIQREASYYIDTKRMCVQAGETFNPNWSKRRIKEEHDRLSRMEQEIANRRTAERNAEYAKLLERDFRELHRGLEIIHFDSGVIATPLVNMRQVQEEGSKMHHCVGSYAGMCAKGEYLVWHLTKDSIETTLGISVNQEKYRYSQHYGYCNAIVEDQGLKQAALDVIERLNEKNQKVVDCSAVSAKQLDKPSPIV